MPRKEGTKSIRDSIKENAPDLYSLVHLVWEKAAGGIHELQAKPDGFQQSTRHALAVERNLSRLIPDDWCGEDKSMRSIDLFVLSVSACLHDAGRGVQAKQPHLADEDHGRLSMRYIRDLAEEYGLTRGQATAVGWVVAAHNTGNLDQLPPESEPTAVGIYGGVNARKLASIFKLADMLHTDETRTFHGDADELHGIPRQKALARRSITGWFLKDDDTICITASPRDGEEMQAVYDCLNYMREHELQPIATMLQLHNFPYKLEISVDTEDIQHKVQIIHRQSTSGFIGMEYYHESDESLFKGRDDDIKKLQELVFGRITLLLGKSGIGKTSLIHAGLLPAMRQYGWECIVTRPDIREGTFFRANDVATLLNDFSITDDEATLEKLYPLLMQAMPGKHILIALDQFEDVTFFGDAMFDAIANALKHIYANRFPKIHLLISYRDDAEGKLGRLWQQVTQSATGGLPRYYLESLTLDGAREVFETTFERLGIGYLPPTLIKDTILPELESESRQQTGENIYPPYLQIVGVKLREFAETTDDMIVTKEAYQDTGGVKRMIGMYLFDSLAELENRGLSREEGEKVLIALTRSTGGKKSCTIDELAAECKISEDRLQQLLRELINLRIIRQLGAGEFEIAHDYLATFVCENIASDDERQYKAVREILSGKAWRYPQAGDLLTRGEMQLLYGFRERVRPNEKEYVLIFRSCVQKEGLGWYWLKNWTKLLQYAYQCTDDANADVRIAAIEAVGKLVATTDNLPLLKQYLSDKEPSVRITVISAIGRLGTADDLSLLKQCLSDKELLVREFASLIIGMRASVDDLASLKQWINDENPYARVAAVVAIGKLGNADDLPLLREKLRDKDLNVREATVEAIIESVDDLASLKQWISDENEYVREAAVKAIGKLGTTADLQLLKQYLNDNEKPHVRQVAIEAIGKLGTSDDLPLLKKYLGDENLDMHENVIEEALNEPYRGVRKYISEEREAAVESICKLATAADLPLLREEWLSNENPYVRYTAVKAIGNLGTNDDIQLLENFLNDKNLYLRRYAIESIGKLSISNELQLLKQYLNDGDSNVRKFVIETIGNLGTSDDLQLLRKYLSDEEEFVRQAAQAAISNLLTAADVPLMKQWLSDENSDVRRTATLNIIRLAGEEEALALVEYAMSLPFDVLQMLDEYLYCPPELWSKDYRNFQPK